MKKKLLALMLTVFTLLGSAYALDLDVSVSSGDFYLFDAYGDLIDLSQAKAEEGVILVTKDSWLDISCTYGDIKMAPDSVITVLSLDPAHPILYLVAGDASFFPKMDYYLEVYTPVSLVSTENKGEFRIVSRKDQEMIYNMNNGYLRVLDAMTGIISELPDLTWTDQIEGTIGDMDSMDYGENGLFIEDDHDLHFFTDLGLPTIQEIEGSELEKALDMNWDIRIEFEPSEPRIPSAPVLEITEHEIEVPPVPAVPEIRVSGTDVRDPLAPPAAPVLTVQSSELTGEPDPVVEEAPVPEAATVSVAWAELTPAEPIIPIPTMPMWIGEPLRELVEIVDPSLPKVPTMPQGLTFRFRVPGAPAIAVKSSVIRRGLVPNAPEFISSKSAPSFLIPDKPFDLRVKTQKYVEPLAAPVVKVYEDKPGTENWDAATYRPTGSRAQSASEKKTTPTLTSSSR